jgi:hypothetical protein
MIGHLTRAQVVALLSRQDTEGEQSEALLEIRLRSCSLIFVLPLAMIDISKEAPNQTSLDADSKIANGVDSDQECSGEGGEKDIEWSWHRTCSW